MPLKNLNKIKTYDFLRLVAQDAGFTIGDVRLIYKSITKIIYLSLLNDKTLYLSGLAKIFINRYTRQLYNFHTKIKEEKKCMRVKIIPAKQYKTKMLKNSDWNNNEIYNDENYSDDENEIDENEFEE